jgi:hypothetical protein
VSPEEEEVARYAGRLILLAFDEEAKAVKQFVRERAGACAGCPGFSPVQFYDRCAAVIAGFRSHLEQMCRAGIPGAPECRKLSAEWDDIKHSLALAGEEAERRRRRDRSSRGPQEWDAAGFGGYPHSDYNSAPADAITPEGEIDELITASITQDPRRWLAEFAAALDRIAGKMKVFGQDYINQTCAVLDETEVVDALRREWAGVIAGAATLADRSRQAKDHLYATPELYDVRQTIVAAIGVLDLMVRRWTHFELYHRSEAEKDPEEPVPEEYGPPPPFAWKQTDQFAESIRNDRAESKLREYASVLRVHCEFSATAMQRGDDQDARRESADQRQEGTKPSRAWQPPANYIRTKEITQEYKVPRTTLQSWQQRDKLNPVKDPESHENYYPKEWFDKRYEIWRAKRPNP